MAGNIADRRLKRPTDPMERIIADALRDAKIPHTIDVVHGTDHNLDFHLPDDAPHGIAIEVKRMHAPRISEQMSRHPDVIVAQGEYAVRLLGRAIRSLGNEGAATRRRTSPRRFRNAIAHALRALATRIETNH